ncbi:MAG TPA: GTPase Era [bacterium]|nr:GTPase Era [bacterium]
MDSSSKPFKAGYAAIVGKPNVGKSTLMNALLQQKLAIVSPRPQTTRNRILGILNGIGYQIILLDTPGIMHPEYSLQQSMVDAACTTMKEADLLIMMIEPYPPDELDWTIMKKCGQLSMPKFLIINKIDRVPKHTLLPLIDEMNQTSVFEAIIPVSALKQDGLQDLMDTLLEAMPAGEPLYPSDIISDEPERFFVAELIREKIFYQYGEEIPYATAVQIRSFEEHSGKKDYIHAVIVVERDSQKGILIGKQGRAIKSLGSSSREAIENFLQRSVFLELEVKVMKKWRKKFDLTRKMGY